MVSSGKDLRTQFGNALLVVVTTAALIAAFINFQQNFQADKRFRLPEDGVSWVDRKLTNGHRAVVALNVHPDSPGAKSGLRSGDRLLRIDGVAIEDALTVEQVLVRLGPWRQSEYLMERRGVEFKVKLIISERVPDFTLSYQYLVGAAYLAIGLFVYFRRVNAQKSLHFLVLCLASFVLSTFHYTGKLNNFDKVIYWGNIAANVLAPTIFLHFCLSFAGRDGWFRRQWGVMALYTPGAVLLLANIGFASGHLRVDLSPIEVRWILDRLLLGFLCLCYVAGAISLWLQYRQAEDPILRQQLKWLRNGAVYGILPFVVFYGAPYVWGVVPTAYMNLAVLSLPLVPLTWAYAIVRYRLMDVDVIFQQGYVHTLATLVVLAVFYALFFVIGKVEDPSPTAVVTLILIATFVFQPIRSWLKEVLDRYYFYRDQYDYRRTLVEFARELSSESNLDRMLEAVADRLIRTLSLQHVAFFLDEEPHRPGGIRLLMTAGRQLPAPAPEYLDLSFLESGPDKPYLFFERTRTPLDVISLEAPQSVRQTIAELDLTYYLPCSVRGKTIGYLGISRTAEGDFLTSDDLELLVTLAGYVGIAVENARLYQSLERKVGEYERLKEFSENIVESINVGILAADLNDRVESWNSQIERLTGIPREAALARRLRDLFPAELVDKFDEVRGETGIHNIYKFVLGPSRRSPRLAVIHGGPGNGNGEPAAPEGSGRETILNIAIAPLVSKEGRQIGRLIIFDDITDRSELEKRLVQADKLSSIGLLAAGVAHEVNTPLAVISSYAQMLAKQVTGDDAKSRLLEKIAKQTFRASEIVNSLLNFSRTSARDFEEVDLNRIAQETVSLVEHQLAKAHVKVELELEAGLPAVKGNAGKLQQVLLNLVLNARDAMEPLGGGRLRLSSVSSDGYVQLEVADSGQGIPAETLPRIFDPFFTTKAGRKGTGLGLSVTYGIVQEHGGLIEVQSEVGQGTVFRLEFPLARKVELGRPA